VQGTAPSWCRTGALVVLLVSPLVDLLDLLDEAFSSVQGLDAPHRDRQQVHDPRVALRGKRRVRALRHPVGDPPGDACR